MTLRAAGRAILALVLVLTIAWALRWRGLRRAWPSKRCWIDCLMFNWAFPMKRCAGRPIRSCAAPKRCRCAGAR